MFGKRAAAGAYVLSPLMCRARVCVEPAYMLDRLCALCAEPISASGPHYVLSHMCRVRYVVDTLCAEQKPLVPYPRTNLSSATNDRLWHKHRPSASLAQHRSDGQS